MAVQTNPKALNLSNLEFDGIKKNIKEFMSGQDEFIDFDFEGSGMSVMLDVMAYTTHYMGFHTNMAINESFLDTATLRNSVVSHAKALGYVPKSVKCAEAIVKLTFDTTGTDPSYIIVEQGTQFISNINGVPLPFTNLDTVNIFADEGGEFSGEIKLSQGTLKGLQWTFDATSETQRFVIKDPTCDRDTISLVIADWPWETGKVLSELDDESRVFFLQEGLDGVSELYFGNGLFGRRPLDGQVIDSIYLSSKGEAGNYTSTVAEQAFALESTIMGNYTASTVVVDTVDISSLGSPQETTANIKQTAPRAYERQDRAVTAEDYKTILIEKYPNIEAIAVWGGEENDPPQYGAVFICIKPKHGLELSPLTKTKLTDEILSKYNMLAINPIITAPEYTYIDVDATVKYDPVLTPLSASEVQTKIIADIEDFFEAELTQFKVTLRYSRLVQTIDSTDISISNNLSSIKMYKKFFIEASNTVGNYIFRFDNAITAGSAVSSVFGNTLASTQFALLDDGQGNVLLYDISGEQFLNTEQGTIDYENGIVQLNGFNPVLDTNTVISLYTTPQSNDITAIRNNLLVLNNSNITMQSINA
jgi:hypothetical protein|tara:strand:+ start:10981 stop:12750 length:1770 start_codon:yes stop_codon:yes gene_type:complete